MHITPRCPLSALATLLSAGSCSCPRHSQKRDTSPNGWRLRVRRGLGHAAAVGTNERVHGTGAQPEGDFASVRRRDVQALSVYLGTLSRACR
ncbi:hypothetical protein HDV57DRAFT_482209 [Trichoderma longibrachiatum]